MGIVEMLFHRHNKVNAFATPVTYNRLDEVTHAAIKTERSVPCPN